MGITFKKSSPQLYVYDSVTCVASKMKSWIMSFSSLDRHLCSSAIIVTLKLSQFIGSSLFGQYTNSSSASRKEKQRWSHKNVKLLKYKIQHNK